MSINTEMTALADAIRAKSGTSGKLSISGMTTAVNNIVINAGSDIDLSGVTVTADKMLSGIVAVGATGEKVIGNIQTVTATSDGTTVTVPVGYIAEQQTFPVGGGTSGGHDTSAVTVTSSGMLAGLVAIGRNGETITGTIPTVTASVSGDKVTVPVGYIAAEQTFDVGGSGIDTTTSVPPSAADVRLGKEFWANGEKYTGTMPDAVVTTETIDGGDIDTRLTISAGCLENDFTIDYLSSGFKNLPFITATADDIREGMVGADAEGNPITGTLVVSGDAPAGGGAFDLAKVTEYIPAVPATEVITSFTLSGFYDELTDEEYNVSEANGAYHVTPETASEVDWRNRKYIHENGKFILYYLDEVGDDVDWWGEDQHRWKLTVTGEGNLGIQLMSTSNLTNGEHEWWASWTDEYPMITTAITQTATTEMKPMVLKGVMAKRYDIDENAWVVGSSEIVLDGALNTPEVGGLYVIANGHTVGMAIAINGEAAIPAGFTSNTSIPGYVVNQSHGDGSYPEAYVVFNHRETEGDYAWWSGNVGVTPNNPCWFSIEVPEAFVPSGIYIMNEILSPQNFKTAIFQGSNNGSSWENLYTIENSPDETGYRQTHHVTCNTAYKYFRMLFTASHQGGVSVQSFQIYKNSFIVE